MWKPASVESNFNLSRHLIPFLQCDPFYAELSRHIQKRFTTDIPTAAVAFDKKSDELVMYINPYFFGGGTYKDKKGNEITDEAMTHTEIRGVLTHEFDHIVFGHLNDRRREPADDWNIATDCAINSLISQRFTKSRSGDNSEGLALPKCGLVPGKRPWVDPTKLEALSPERKKAVEHFSDLIEKFPTGKASEWYFNKLQEDRKKNPDKYPQGIELVIGPMDDHGGWDEVPEEMREYIEGKVKSLIEKAVRHADSHADGWGSIPSDIREEIRRSVSTVVNWRNVLRQFVGSLVRGNRTTSIKRINRRYPYIHPGVKKGYTAKLLIAIDESGSVGDNMLEMFFAELEQLTRKVDVTLLHFDCSCSEADLYEWKKGARPKLERVKTGGTNFDAPTNLVNDVKNRGRWDGMLIMTDGCAPAPGPSRIKRGWVLGTGCKLNFDSNEIQIFLSDAKALTGAWR